MNYVKAALGAVAAIIIGTCVNAWPIFSETKATGLAAVVGILKESLLSPLFWIVTLAAFALFFFASRLGNKTLRVLLFWLPTLAVSGLSITIAVLIACLILNVHFRH